ncbi:MAG: L-serine ammonia-lyase, partial [Rhizobacter sp.]|nr:L-serine ammonia-lyase [Rhizobacter sp.]
MLSTFDIFKIGIGPSSSHTVGPMRAASTFVRRLEADGLLADVHRLDCKLYGSLGATGRGHATDQGVMLGLLGEAPDTVAPESVQPQLDAVRRSGRLLLLGVHAIGFDRVRDITFAGEESLPGHPNAMRFAAFDASGATLLARDYYSVGGGFVVDADAAADAAPIAPAATPALAHAFTTGDELMARCAATGLSVAQLVMANECTWRSEAEVRAGLLRIWTVMRECVARGFGLDNPLAARRLPGPLQIKRRAPELQRTLSSSTAAADPLAAMDWVNAYAMAVNEENAMGGRVVTAPTNGAAGVVPAV